MKAFFSGLRLLSDQDSELHTLVSAISASVADINTLIFMSMVGTHFLKSC